MKHITAVVALAFSASAVAQESTHEACKKSVEAARAMLCVGRESAAYGRQLHQWNA